MPRPNALHPLLSSALLGLCAAAGTAQADAVTEWNANAGAAAVAACLSPDGNPLHESRLYAMLHLAAYDAVNAIHRRGPSYAYREAAAAGTSAEAAIAAAAREVLVSQIPLAGVPAQCAAAGISRAEADYAKALSAIAEGPGKAQGIALGRGAAAAVIARRASDGSTAPLVDPQFPQGTAPGEWRFTPGSPPVAFGASWGSVAPFALRDATQFEPGHPLSVSCRGREPEDAKGCRKYAVDLEEVRRLGSDGVSAPSARSEEQTEIALFWLESSPLAWNRIARGLSSGRRLGLVENARLFALLNAAQADGYVASWATKYHYRFWRPVTAIRAADEDGNPGTSGDAAWTPLRPTPPVPDYESAHALEGAAAAEVLKSVFGRRHVAFSACSRTLPGRTCEDANPAWRRFRSLDEAVAENGDSRVYIGFHFRDAVEKGIAHGRRIGRWTVDNLLSQSRPYRAAGL